MKCPGQDRGFWTGAVVTEVPCPECGASVEIFKDESTGRCRRCGHRFLNPGKDFGCAQWCSLAKECLGFAPEQRSRVDAGESALAARLIQWVEQTYPGDLPRIARTLKVFQHAKDLVRQEGGNPRIVVSAAILIASESPEPTGGTVAVGESHQAGGATGLEEARRAGLDEPSTAQVREIIRSYRKGEDRDAIDFRLVADACTLVSLTQRFPGKPDDWENIVETSLRTPTAKTKARCLFSA